MGFDVFTKRRIQKDIIDKVFSTDKKEIYLEMAKEFGRRWKMGVNDGLPPEIAFEACKRHYAEVGQAMMDIAEVVKFEEVDPNKEQSE